MQEKKVKREGKGPGGTATGTPEEPQGAGSPAAPSSSGSPALAMLPPPLPGVASKVDQTADPKPAQKAELKSDSAAPRQPKPAEASSTDTKPTPLKPVPSATLQSNPSSAVKTGPAAQPEPAPAAAPEPPAVEAEEAGDTPRRRVARRRPAGPARNRIAANDDAPSIGGLIYALDQKPSNKPFKFAAAASIAWALIGGAFSWLLASTELSAGVTALQLLARPTTFLVFAAIAVPIALTWLMALLAWRAEELRLRSSTMTEVAVRLAEPDRMAEQSIASLGQAVRRQVSFMNDAVSRALGRAGELEALVHSEVAALERSYEENERKIRGLIQELTGERTALVDTSDKVSDTLRSLGSEVPALIEKLSSQQIKLAQIIQGAGENLTNLEGAIGQATGRLETSLGTRTEHLHSVLHDYTAAIGGALEARTENMQRMLETYTNALGVALDSRTENMQTVFEEYTRALDTTIANRAGSLDSALIERTKAIDSAFAERLRLFDESIQHSTAAIDMSVNEKALALTGALDRHAKAFAETVDKQASDLDDALMRGINSVRRSSENITRQSMKAIEGLASQSDLLKSVSENLLGQIHNVTSRFEKQGQQILGAASALETVNYKIDSTLQNRHADMSRTLDRLSNKADEFGRFIEGYSTSIEGSLTEAELRARAAAEELKRGTETQQRAALADLARMKAEADAESERALMELRSRFSTVSTEMTEQLGSLSSRFDATSEEVRRQAARTAQELADEQARLRREMEQLPSATRESADAVRRALQDQLKALDQLSSFTSRTAAERDVMPPLPGSKPAADAGRGVPSLSSALAQEMSQRQRPAGAQEPPQHRPANPPQVPAAAAPPADSRAGWSLGDLLARASHDGEDEPGARPVQPALAAPYTLDINSVARALDAAAASAIWSRLRAGQRGIMVRSIYSPDGRLAFDEIARRYKTDADLRATIDRYLADFERLLRDSDAKDPSGRQAHAQVVSDGGRVYLFLAHAAGRLS